jgi:hypothetical protein
MKLRCRPLNRLQRSPVPSVGDASLDSPATNNDPDLAAVEFADRAQECAAHAFDGGREGSEGMKLRCRPLNRLQRSPVPSVGGDSRTGPFEIVAADPSTSTFTFNLPPHLTLHPRIHASKLWRRGREGSEGMKLRCRPLNRLQRSPVPSVGGD